MAAFDLSTIPTGVNALSNLVLAIPNLSSKKNDVKNTIGYQPQNLVNTKGPLVKALLFHYEGEQVVNLESEITDHFIEDNTSIQDHWAIRPEEIVTRGYIGELNNVPISDLSKLKTLANALTPISAYVPVLPLAAQLLYDETSYLYSVASSAKQNVVSAWDSINGKEQASGEAVIDGGFNVQNTNQPNQSKQQIAFQQFYGYWRKRTLFTVQTPWAVFQNMAIKRITAIQDDDTLLMSGFEVVFKLIRTGSNVEFRSVQAPISKTKPKAKSKTKTQTQAQPRLAAQKAPVAVKPPLAPQTYKGSVNFGDYVAIYNPTDAEYAAGLRPQIIEAGVANPITSPLNMVHTGLN